MIDCHLHLQDPRLESQLEEIIETLRTRGIRQLIVNGTHPGDWDAVEALAERYPEVTPSFGLHPWRVGEEGKGWLDELESRLRRNPSALVGEIGLDRWIANYDFPRQKEALIAQLALASQYQRAVSLHCLRAWGALLECLRDWQAPVPFLLHSYGGSRELIASFSELGAYFSISGYFFRPEKANQLIVFDAIPRDRLLLETDAPDMAGPPTMQQFTLDEGLNHPANLEAIYEAVAKREQVDVEVIITRTQTNLAAWMGRKP